MAAVWFRPDGRPATPEEARELLIDGAARLLAQDFVHVGSEVIVISTLFTVFDHAPSPHGRPLLWETVVAEDEQHQTVARYASRVEAEQGHQVFKEWVTNRALELAGLRSP